MRGRKPKPTNLKLLEGNPGKRPLPANEPKPRPISPKCPAWLNREAKRLWKKLMPELERLGLMTIINGPAFEAVCQSYATWVHCEKYLEKHGLTLDLERHDKEGNVIGTYVQQRPEVAIGQKALQAMKAFCTEFGLTPASMSRISTGRGAEDDDPMERLLRGVGG